MSDSLKLKPRAGPDPSLRGESFTSSAESPSLSALRCVSLTQPQSWHAPRLRRRSGREVSAARASHVQNPQEGASLWHWVPADAERSRPERRAASDTGRADSQRGGSGRT
ncbi:hypothetical protein AAFF_G00283810 [Aldrovandia affinis]|uniref:Uncharacterized protein n=1 Tax=Aldrovandia affinis TaxID=143900 RepID=A0AAD7TA24_9TELE|nr:hypothetical protein AAFF_G00283810 [Aldrovandia affinis]